MGFLSSLGLDAMKARGDCVKHQPQRDVHREERHPEGGAVVQVPEGERLTRPSNCTARSLRRVTRMRKPTVGHSEHSNPTPCGSGTYACT